MTPLEEIYHLLSSKLKLSKDQIDKAVETNTYIKTVIAPDIYQEIKNLKNSYYQTKRLLKLQTKIHGC